MFYTKYFLLEKDLSMKVFINNSEILIKNS